MELKNFPRRSVTTTDQKLVLGNQDRCALTPDLDARLELEIIGLRASIVDASRRLSMLDSILRTNPFLTPQQRDAINFLNARESDDSEAAALIPDATSWASVWLIKDPSQLGNAPGISMLAVNNIQAPNEDTELELYDIAYFPSTDAGTNLEYRYDGANFSVVQDAELPLPLPPDLDQPAKAWNFRFPAIAGNYHTTVYALAFVLPDGSVWSPREAGDVFGAPRSLLRGVNAAGETIDILRTSADGLYIDYRHEVEATSLPIEQYLPNAEGGSHPAPETPLAARDYVAWAVEDEFIVPDTFTVRVSDAFTTDSVDLTLQVIDREAAAGDIADGVYPHTFNLNGADYSYRLFYRPNVNSYGAATHVLVLELSQRVSSLAFINAAAVGHISLDAAGDNADYEWRRGAPLGAAVGVHGLAFSVIPGARRIDFSYAGAEVFSAVLPNSEAGYLNKFHFGVDATNSADAENFDAWIFNAAAFIRHGDESPARAGAAIPADVLRAYAREWTVLPSIVRPGNHHDSLTLDASELKITEGDETRTIGDYVDSKTAAAAGTGAGLFSLSENKIHPSGVQANQPAGSVVKSGRNNLSGGRVAFDITGAKSNDLMVILRGVGDNVTSRMSVVIPRGDVHRNPGANDATERVYGGRGARNLDLLCVCHNSILADEVADVQPGNAGTDIEAVFFLTTRAAG